MRLIGVHRLNARWQLCKGLRAFSLGRGLASNAALVGAVIEFASSAIPVAACRADVK
ncbi:hypothetical protein [Zoogloea sp.]|uniref:hypothetical protein n=1 Tax=Zoogloea sp. TaxID=49181 RepID=UPI0035B087A3